MGDVARKSGGRQIFTVEFKRGIVQQSVKGKETERKGRVEAGATVVANGDVVPASALPEAQQRIRELERLLGRKAGAPERVRSVTSRSCSHDSELRSEGHGEPGPGPVGQS